MITNKLKGISHIYYLNLDCRVDRRDYMESQFDTWEIKDYTRIKLNKGYKKFILTTDGKLKQNLFLNKDQSTIILIHNKKLKKNSQFLKDFF